MQMSADKGDDYQITTHVQKIFSRSNIHQIEVPLATISHHARAIDDWCVKLSRTQRKTITCNATLIWKMQCSILCVRICHREWHCLNLLLVESGNSRLQQWRLG